MTELVWEDAIGQAAAIRRGTASSAELVHEYLARIERLNPRLRAFVSVDAERAIADGEATDAAVRRGASIDGQPFAGVAISVKDVIDVANLPTTHSCKALADNVATADHPLVERMRRAGFIVLGKTNVPEFCTSMTTSELNGICRNPWDPELTPSGSSGGAAVSVAAAMCAVAHGTDGAGSVRMPAAYCGLVGFKPTRGLVSFGPQRGEAYFGTSVDGILSRSVRDAAAIIDVFTGRATAADDPAVRPPAALADAWREDPTRLRIAVSTTPPYGEVEVECAQAARDTADILALLGHDVVDATPRWNTILEAAFGPMSVPGVAGLVRLDQIDFLEPRNRPLLERSAQLTVVDHARWVELCRARTADFVRFWDDIDVLVTPTAGFPPPPAEWAPWDQTPEEHMATFSTFTNFAQPFNLSGQPALSLPMACTSTGLPLGVHLAARHHGERTLLRVAGQLERVRPWNRRRPPIARS